MKLYLVKESKDSDVYMFERKYGDSRHVFTTYNQVVKFVKKYSDSIRYKNSIIRMIIIKGDDLKFEDIEFKTILSRINLIELEQEKAEIELKIDMAHEELESLELKHKDLLEKLKNR